ncbi:MAG: hypothetical protein ACLSAF_05420 [Intestinimonas sp.]
MMEAAATRAKAAERSSESELHALLLSSVGDHVSSPGRRAGILWMQAGFPAIKLPKLKLQRDF